MTNVQIIILLLVLLGVLIGYFVKLDRDNQLCMLKEWLLLAVVQAEKELGNGTGQIKLRFVYDLFIQKFPKLCKIITFTQFSILVDEALEIMREMMANNKNVEEYINK